MHTLTMRRIYGDSGKPVAGEFRILVDRLWPRGISKAAAALDVWEKEIAPGKDLRSWFGHDPDKFEEFSRRYRAELEANPLTPAFCEMVRKAMTTADVVLLYGAKDEEHNQAIVLAQYVQEKLRAAVTD